MPTYTRIAQDQNVEAVYLVRQTKITTPYGDLIGPSGSWAIYDYLGHAEILSYDEFKAKFNPTDQEATDYLLKWKPFAQLVQLEPERGPTGSTVYISGFYFGAAQGTSQVFFGVINDKEATVLAWDDNMISVTVPAGLPIEYPVYVQIVKGTKRSNQLPFQVSV